MRKDCFGHSCIVLHTYQFLLQFVVQFLCQKHLQTLYNVIYIFCAISGSKITTEHFSLSCVIVHSLPPEILVQYFLSITTFIIYNCICYSCVINFIIATANTVTVTITETFIWILHNFQHFTVCQTFFCQYYAPSITPELTVERSALTENVQGEYQLLQNIC